MEGGHLVVVGLVIAACLEQENAETLAREVCRERSAAGAGSDHDIVVNLTLAARVTRERRERLLALDEPEASG